MTTASKPTTQEQFHAWAAAVRASLERIEALGQAGSEKQQALQDLLRSPDPDPRTVLALRQEIDACQREIEALIAALPALHARRSATRAGALAWPAFLDASLSMWAASAV